MSEEEYQYTEENFSDESSEAKEVAPNLIMAGLAKIKNKRLFIPVALVVAVFLVYQVVVPSSTSKAVDEAEQTQSQDVAPAASLADVEGVDGRSQLSLQNDDIQNKIDVLKQENQSDREQIKHLALGLNRAQATLVSFQQSMKQLNSSVQSLSVQLAEQKKQSNPKEKAVVKPLYYVRAVVSGRAWLKSSVGDSLTVRVGDNITGYGKVENIDPELGVVAMSDGSVFEYGENDS